MSRHWPSGDFYGVEAIISAHSLLNDQMQNEDTKTTLPYRKKLQECLADVEKAVVLDFGRGSLVLECFNFLELRWKVLVLSRARTAYIHALTDFGGRIRYPKEGPGVRVPTGPCRQPLHLELGEEFCGCGIQTDTEGTTVKHYWIIPYSDPSHACGEGCLMPRDWALKMVKQKALYTLPT